MTDTPTEAERKASALAAVTAYLAENLPTARLGDRYSYLQPLAFPNGMIGPEFDGGGRVLSMGVVPDDGSHINDLIQKAHVEREAFDAACIRAGHDLFAGNDINDELRCFASEVLLGRLKRPKGKKGNRELGRYSCAHQTLVLAIHRVIEHGFYATKTETKPSVEERICAIEIVSEAMKRLGERPSNPAYLKDVWEERIHKKDPDGMFRINPDD